MNININQAIAEENALPPGSYRVQFDLTEPADISAIKETLENNGVRAYVRQWRSGDQWHLAVSYKKSSAEAGISFLPQAVVPLIAFTMAATLIGISIFRIKDITDSLTKLLLVVGGITVLTLVLTRKPRA